jgi:hypothetical protein
MSSLKSHRESWLPSVRKMTESKAERVPANGRPLGRAGDLARYDIGVSPST